MPISILHLRPKTVLRARGEDALSFLQGQFTNDVKSLADGASSYGLWLNQKGKVLGDSTVLRFNGNDFLLVSEAMESSALRDRLESYLIADDVELSDETHAWSLLRTRTQPVPSAPLPSLAHASDTHPFAVCEKGTGTFQDLLVRPEQPVPFPEFDLVNAEQMRASRIEAGIPLVGVDLDARDLPNEGGLEHVAVSYTKGCYLGQEVMARLHAMGQVRRRLHVVKGTGQAPATPSEVRVGEKVAGELRSAVPVNGGWVGFAMLSLLTLGDVKQVQVAGGEASVTL